MRKAETRSQDIAQALLGCEAGVCPREVWGGVWGRMVAWPGVFREAEPRVSCATLLSGNSLWVGLPCVAPGGCLASCAAPARLCASWATAGRGSDLEQGQCGNIPDPWDCPGGSQPGFRAEPCDPPQLDTLH